MHCLCMCARTYLENIQADRAPRDVHVGMVARGIEFDGRGDVWVVGGEVY